MSFYTYALLLVGSLSIPLLRSFEPRVAYYTKWKGLFLGVSVMMLVFIPWDIIFTRMGIWSFNPQYITGLYVLGLPVEEWLFFVVIPFCCVFVYEVLKYFFPGFYMPEAALILTVVISVTAFVLGLLFASRLYTLVVMSLSVVLLILQLALKTHRKWLSHFYLMFFVSLIPFFVVNGILTALPVVSYNDLENMAVRIGSVPVEDVFYFLSMMLVTIPVYEVVGKLH